MQYIAVLRSKTKEFSPAHFQSERDFGGSGSTGSSGYIFREISFPSTNDITAKRKASAIAAREHMVLSRVSKTEVIYENKNVPA